MEELLFDVERNPLDSLTKRIDEKAVDAALTQKYDNL
jgi:hypothetical protein